MLESRGTNGSGFSGEDASRVFGRIENALNVNLHQLLNHLSLENASHMLTFDRRAALVSVTESNGREILTNRKLDGRTGDNLDGKLGNFWGVCGRLVDDRVTDTSIKRGDVYQRRSASE